MAGDDSEEITGNQVVAEALKLQVKFFTDAILFMCFYDHYIVSFALGHRICFRNCRIPCNRARDGNATGWPSFRSNEK